MIKPTNKLTGRVNASTIHVYPDLEDITVTPQLEKQILTPTAYGFKEVIVNEIPAIETTIEPSLEQQIEEGIFKKVTVSGIPQKTLNVVPSEEEQNEKGVYTEVNIEAIQTEEKVPTLDFSVSNEIEITPTKGRYIKKVTINKPTNLVPDIIKAGENVFGINGSLEKLDTSDADATADDIAFGKVAYANDQKIVGTMQVNNNNAMIDTSARPQATLAGLSVITKMDFTGIDTSGYTTANSGFQTFRALQEVIGLDCSTITNMARMFYYCEDLISAELLNSGKVTSTNEMFLNCYGLVTSPTFDTSSVTNMASMYQQCEALVNASELDTSNVTTMLRMFHTCKQLVNVPVYNTSKLTTMATMFTNCSRLSDASLNNIMQMCIGTTSTYTASKSLKSVGLTSAQATRCQSLPNYQAFLDAGWVTGY